MKQSAKEEKKTFRECLDDISKKYGYRDWKQMENLVDSPISSRTDEAAEQYASQFKPLPVEEQRLEWEEIYYECMGTYADSLIEKMLERYTIIRNPPKE